MLALPLELSTVLWMRGLSTVPEEIGSPHQGQVSGVHVGHVAEGGQVSQVLDQVFQRSAVVLYEERKKFQVIDAHPLGTARLRPSPDLRVVPSARKAVSEMAQQAP